MKQLIFWLALFSLIVFRYFSTRPVYQNGDTVRITTVVYSDPVDYPGSQSLKAGGLKISLPLFPEINYGDLITVTGIVDNGKLSKAKLLSDKLEQSFGSKLRNKITVFYQKTLPEPMSGILAGITLGSKESLTQDFYTKVKNVGVSFIVGATGLKVTLIISFLMGVLTLVLPRRKAIPFVILGILLYLLVSGLNTSLTRAVIMSSFLFLGQETGRLVSKWRILLLTAIVMLIIQPDQITDIGFILSFVSLTSIMLFEKRIEKLLKFIPKILREDFSVALAAQIGMTPILFVTFGQFNIWSPVVSVLTLWIVPYVMILGTIGGNSGANLSIPRQIDSLAFLSNELVV